MMSLINNLYKKIRTWFIGEQLLSNYYSDIYKSKLKLAYSVYFIFALLGYLWIIYLITSPYKFLLVFSVLLALIHTGLLFALKYFDALRLTGIISVAASFAVINIQMFYSQGTVNFVTCSWLIILSLFVFFIYGRKEGLGLILMSILSIFAFTILNIIGYRFPHFIIDDRLFYMGVFISLVFVFLFTYLIIDRYLKYSEKLFGHLNESEVRLSTIVDNLPSGGVYVFKGKIFFNKKFEMLTGYMSDEINDFAHLKQLLIPDEEDRLIFNLIRDEKTDLSNNVINIIDKSGNLKTVEVYAKKGMEYEICLFKDISEFKDKEHRLKESDYFIENIAKALPHILYVFDFEKRENIYVNASLTNILGYTAEEFRTVFKKVYDSIHPDDIQNVMAHIRAIYKLPDEQLHTVEFRIKHKNGSYVWMRSVEKVFKRSEEGSVQLVIGISEDITASKQDELKNLRINQILKAINIGRSRAMVEENFDDSMLDLLEEASNSIGIDEIFVCEHDNEYEHDNFHDKYTWKKKLHAQKTDSLYSDCDKNCLDDILQARINDLRQGSTIFVNEKDKDFYTLLHAKNVKSVLIAPIFFSGKFWGVLIAKNKTEEKIWEEFEISIIQNFANTLGAAISKNNYKVALEVAVEKLEFASKAKSDFLASISHEIKTPMNAITGLTNIMLQENKNKKQLEYLLMLKNSSESLLLLMNDILDYKRLESRHDVLRQNPFVFRNMIDSVFKNNRFIAVEKGLNLAYDIDEKIPSQLIGDENKLRTVLNNLVNNALKYTEKGMVTLNAKLSYKESGMVNILFNVTDTGIGIADNMKEKIFEEFNNLSVVNKKYQGTGLGLAIVKRILEMHNSKIQVDSIQGKGSSFFFNISFATVKKNDAETSVPKSVNASLAGLNVLTVEDNEVNALILKKILRTWNVNITNVFNGKAATDIFSTEHFDMILLDLMLPDIEGYEVAQFIRNHQDINKSQTPIIAITATMLSDAEEKILRAGINDFIPKPINPDELQDKIISLMEKSQKTKKVAM
jgi:PAS domain S-box-containing protein